MKTYLIGRGADCCVDVDDNSISTLHAELVITVGNELYLTDRASTNGTFVFRDNSWVAVRQDFITVNDRLMFGRFEMSVNDLLKQVQAVEARRGSEKGGDGELDPDVIEGAVRRDEFGKPVSRG